MPEKNGIVNSTMSGIGALNVIKNWAVRQSITDIGTESIKLEWTETPLLKRLKNFLKKHL